MEFVDHIATPKLDGVVFHSPFHDPVDGTLCITGHHIILSSRKEDDAQELWVQINYYKNLQIFFFDLFSFLSCYTTASISWRKNKTQAIPAIRKADQ